MSKNNDSSIRSARSDERAARGWLVLLLLVPLLSWLALSTHLPAKKHAPLDHSAALPEPTQEQGPRPSPVITQSVAAATAEPLVPYDSARLLHAARAYHDGKSNIYFQEREFRFKLAQRSQEVCARIKEELSAHQMLDSLPTDVRFSEARPAAVTDRMALIDLLEGLLEQDAGAGANRDAVTVLRSLIESPLPRDVPPQVKRVLVGEKFDSLVALTHHQRELALQLFANLPDVAMKRSLFSALMLGLMDVGVKPDEISRLLDPLDPEA